MIKELKEIALTCFSPISSMFHYLSMSKKYYEKIDAENDYEDALRGSVIGVFQMVIAGKESVEHLIESAAILKSVESSPSVNIFLFRIVSNRTSSVSKQAVMVDVISFCAARTP